MMTLRLVAAAFLAALTVLAPATLMAQGSASGTPVPVTVKTFARAESDLYFGNTVKLGGFGKLYHYRMPTPIEKQEVVRMNRDTLYSAGVFDLDAGPVTIVLPDAGKRFMSVLIISEDHYAPLVGYAPGSFTLTKENAGTRYVMAAVRTLADPNDAADLKAANTLQDKIKVQQAAAGTFDVPNWEPGSQGTIRDHLAAMQALGGCEGTVRMGPKGAVDPVCHLMATATGWGLNPPEAAVYDIVFPKANDGTTVQQLTVKEVPVDGFWSISVYNAKGYFEKNALDSYSINNLTAKPNADGSFTIQFGGCTKDTVNCLVTPPGWNYTARQYRPRKAILDGTWKFPEAQPAR
jgi:para-nitrobenzyl esterase